jgi:penicillin-binding protein 1A
MRGRELELSLEQTPLVQGAFAAIDVKTRNVLALVGGYDIARSQFNRATQAKRQPGSAFKPILYAAAIETGKFTPATRMDDSPEVITDPFTGKTWKPQNFEKDSFDGPLPLRRALAMSKNTIAVKLLLDVGLDRVRQVARMCGLSTEVPRSYTAALGTGEVIPLELVNAYTTLAALGRKADPLLIRKVREREGKVIWTAEPTGEPSIKPQVAYITADMMRSVIEDPEGTARSLGVLTRPIAGKTGTASEHRDAWFVGFTPSMVAGAWVGFDNHDRLGPAETGGHAAGPIWLRFMKAATSGAPIEEWPAPPPGVTVAKVNRNTGQLSTDANDPFGQKEVFLAGTEPATTPASQNQEQFLKEH